MQRSRVSWLRGPHSLLWGALLAASVAACSGGCRKEQPVEQAVPAEPSPTLRVFALGGVAGEVEPCGCVKDMLGGIDHAAALIAADESTARLVVGAGPMFFAEPQLSEQERRQARLKADALAESFAAIQLVGWAPGANDWALGAEVLGDLAGASSAAPLAANLGKGAGPVTDALVVERAGTKIGVIGVSDPTALGVELDFEVGEVEEALQVAKAKAQSNGAQLLVALLAVDRGTALRIVEKVGGLHLAVVGKPLDRGAASDPTTAPIVVGETLVVQSPNHLQALTSVELFLRDGDTSLQDATGLELQERRASLQRRARELEERLAGWKQSGGDVSPADIEAREADLARLHQQLQALERPSLPNDGSFFLVDVVEVREELGEHPAVAARLKAYYKRVNQLNQKLFADRQPPPVEEDESGYVGVEQCSACHQPARAFWNGMAHAHAYETLARDHKQFNLDCVSCHVTGYEKPGGSTVTHVENLKDVQCEVCHGPGSRHVTDPANPEWMTRVPERSLCASQCHHPPHVHESWDVDTAWAKIIGPGHGLPVLQPAD